LLGIAENVPRRGIPVAAIPGDHGDMTRTLLLFSGAHDQPRGGAGDLVGWFDGEDEALAAFRELRLRRSDKEGWAELVALDDGPRPSLRAWFGRPAGERRLRVVANRGHHPAGRGRHLRLLAR
jgi:hypothetical protein